MSERTGDDLILERMYAREQVLLSQADALDMKASYLLVVLVFLAQLSTTFLLKPDLSCLAEASQWGICLLLVVSGIFLLLELRIKRFSNEDAADLEAFRDKVVTEAQGFDEYKQARDPDAYLRGRLVWGLILSSKVRIGKNEGINDKKADRLKWAYYLAFAAFLSDILFMVTIIRLF